MAGKHSLLKNVSIFSGVPDKDLDTIADCVFTRKVPKDRFLVREKEKVGEEFYIIKKGQVKVSRHAPDGTDVVLAILGPGDFFGEMSLIDGLIRSANVVSLSQVELLILTKKNFLSMLHNHARISLNLLKVLCGRLRRSDALIKGIKTTNIVGRVASVLLSLADYSGSRKAVGVELSNMPPLANIAEMAYTTVDNAAGVLKDFSKSGYIKKSGKKLTIINYAVFKNIFV